MTELDQLNAAPEDELRDRLRRCCPAPEWISAVTEGRPYPDLEAVLRTSDGATERLDDAGLAQALAGHPRIGERTREAFSAQEQAGMAGADAALRARLAEANRRYEEEFGRIYLVSASGRTADELLELCLQRLGSTAADEQRVVRRELAAINRRRLRTLLGVV